jgi:hypothetical protein
MRKEKVYLILSGVLGVLLLISLAFLFSNKPVTSLGGTVHNVQEDFSAGIKVNGTELINSSGKLTSPLVTGVIYENDTSSAVGSLKMHNHLTTSEYNTQLRSEFIGTSGTHWGIDSETHLNANGTASIRGVQGVAKLSTGYTSTAGTLIGSYGQARADGTFNAAGGFLIGQYGLIEASAAVTASHVASIWADSHQANAVTGEHELIYASNNGAATMDSVMYVYGGDKVTNLLKLKTVSGMVSDTAETAGASKKIKIDIDGTTYYLNAYAGS